MNRAIYLDVEFPDFIKETKDLLCQLRRLSDKVVLGSLQDDTLTQVAVGPQLLYLSLA